MNRMIVLALVSYMVGVAALGWMIPSFLGRLAAAAIERRNR